jgi:hypothetical protein
LDERDQAYDEQERAVRLWRLEVLASEQSDGALLERLDATIQSLNAARAKALSFIEVREASLCAQRVK